jgi:hypothetical protein
MAEGSKLIPSDPDRNLFGEWIWNPLDKYSGRRSLCCAIDIIIFPQPAFSFLQMTSPDMAVIFLEPEKMGEYTPP